MLLPRNTKNPLYSLPLFCDVEDPFPFQTYMFQVFRNLAVAQASNVENLSKEFIAWVVNEFFDLICKAPFKPRSDGDGVITISKELTDFVMKMFSNCDPKKDEPKAKAAKSAIPLLDSKEATSNQESGMLRMFKSFSQSQATQMECLAKEILTYVRQEWLQAMQTSKLRSVNGVDCCDITISREIYDLSSMLFTAFKGTNRRKAELVPECRSLFNELKQNGLTPKSPKPLEDLNPLLKAEIYNTQVPSQERRLPVEQAPVFKIEPVATEPVKVNTEVIVEPKVAAKTKALSKAETANAEFAPKAPTAAAREKKKKLAL